MDADARRGNMDTLAHRFRGYFSSEKDNYSKGAKKL